jgi:hypothetical protein
VASSTGVPNRVRELRPPAMRSSPVTVGPAFSRSTAMANQDPPGRGLEQVAPPSEAVGGRGRRRQGD